VKISRGFTFVELIVAMVLIVIVSIASLEFFKYCYKNFLVPDELKLEAVNYAAGSMEKLYMEDPASSSLAVTAGWVDVDGGAITEGKLGNRSGHKYKSITTMNSGSANEYKLIKTKVTWTR
jgi:prepilin-type N-terminal cleavage/methylation domain-containing protein